MKDMKISPLISMVFALFIIGGCGDSGGSSDHKDTNALSSWDKTKQKTVIDVALPLEFQSPSTLSISTMGWEDGINISRNGLHLYATYIPADFLAYVLNGESDPEKIQLYDRGPHYDMDLVSNPAEVSYPWYQSDIIYTSRSTISENFSPWNTSNLKRHTYSEGALSTVFSGATIDIAAFTSNDEYTALNNIKIVSSTSADPSGVGSPITATDISGTTSINTNYIEDNPHLERLDSNNIVLFFDSEDRPGGEGSHDIWYATSADNGSSWTTPAAVSTINTSSKEHQPHLYFDGLDWWLYYSAYHTDAKLAIFRSKQLTPSDWNNWGTAEVVLSAGNAEGIGEPTLTSDGDLYFVVVYKNSEGSYYDTYDADPWVALKQDAVVLNK